VVLEIGALPFPNPGLAGSSSAAHAHHTDTEGMYDCLWPT
jgi:hypothetical protein